MWDWAAGVNDCDLVGCWRGPAPTLTPGVPQGSTLGLRLLVLSLLLLGSLKNTISDENLISVAVKGGTVHMDSVTLGLLMLHLFDDLGL